VLLVPLAGHLRGHCGVAVLTPERWLFQCGGAYVCQMQVDPDRSLSPFPLWIEAVAGRMFPPEPVARVRVLLRQHDGEVEVSCSHDREGLARFQVL
jgi:hypothetical protein